MKATELLHRQHRLILQLLNDLELERHYRLPLLRELEERLHEHIALEEGVFLERVRGVLRRGVWLMRETHANALDGIRCLMDLRDDVEAFPVAVASFRASLAAGIEREEREVFHALEAALAVLELEQLAETMSGVRAITAMRPMGPMRPMLLS
ncbi:MAG: hypothetical protein JWM74_743 [Myxococcaceae bacterium]|nr:hypothetical protein [Myxococcaceae bacterium]